MSKNIKSFKNFNKKIEDLLNFISDTIIIDNYYAHAELSVEQLSNGEISIHISEIWSDIKGKGYATSLLNYLKEYSNKNNIPLTLRASISNNIKTSNGLNQTQLINWYKKNGFNISENDNNFESDTTAPFMIYNPNL